MFLKKGFLKIYRGFIDEKTLFHSGACFLNEYFDVSFIPPYISFDTPFQT